VSTVEYNCEIFKMANNYAEKIIDTEGNQILFTGTENYNEYYKKLIQVLRIKDCYFVLDEDYLNARPLKPTELLLKRINHSTTSANEDKKIAEWNLYVEKSKSGSTKALHIIKKTFGKDINTWIEYNIDNNEEAPTPETVQTILTEVEKTFGGYTFTKDTRSRRDLDSIPKFTTSQSIFDGIEKIKSLNEERKKWEKIGNQPENTYASLLLQTTWIIEII
jgi:hypothetical protein